MNNFEGCVHCVCLTGSGRKRSCEEQNTNNQKSLTIAKILVEKWFNVFGIPARIHSDQGRSFDNEIISSLCKMYGIRQSTTMPYNPHGNSQCKWFNRTLFSLMRMLDQE